MAKITSKIQNPFFSEDMAGYLEENGFYKSSRTIAGTMFIKDDRAVLINGDKASFRVFDEGEESRRQAEFSEFASFEGIDCLDTNGWIMLLHVTGIITIREFKNNVMRLNKQLPTVVQMAEEFSNHTS
jgi:hypothetical protein